MTYFSYGQVLKTNYNNLYQNTIKYNPPLTKNHSKTKIHFLDITITKTSTGKLLTTPHKKEIERKCYLHRKSELPETLK